VSLGFHGWPTSPERAADFAGIRNKMTEHTIAYPKSYKSNQTSFDLGKLQVLLEDLGKQLHRALYFEGSEVETTFRFLELTIPEIEKIVADAKNQSRAE
jgi:hypothetical protein